MSLKAEKRDKTGRQVGQIREKGLIPAVVYGHGFENEAIAIPLLQFAKALEVAGESTLVDLQVGSNDPYKVIIQDVQRDPVSNTIIHADLRRVRMDEKIDADIPIVFVGSSAAVKEKGGILITTLDSVSVKALPQDLVHEFTVDISPLKTFDDVIRVKDIGIPDSLEVLSPLEAAVALVEEPRLEEIPTGKPEDEVPEGAEEETDGEAEGENKDGQKDDKKEEKPEDGDKKE